MAKAARNLFAESYEYTLGYVEFKRERKRERKMFGQMKLEF